MTNPEPKEYVQWATLVEKAEVKGRADGKTVVVLLQTKELAREGYRALGRGLGEPPTVSVTDQLRSRIAELTQQRDEARAELERLRAAQVPFDREAWAKKYAHAGEFVDGSTRVWLFGEMVGARFSSADSAEAYASDARKRILATIPPKLGPTKAKSVTADRDKPETWPKAGESVFAISDGTVPGMGPWGAVVHSPSAWADSNHGCRWVRVVDVFGKGA